ncbi:uncharacterized protein LOC131888641 [Tigriopus californicus]|uniref:uncharacterized protein LOC131888641 n=1 Tax=Tigriopus californicus TaxID=6832 RepID=UPI0027DA9CF9|nr:uncharacterized protein LOC131888641 [Tigriopus californicus]
MTRHLFGGRSSPGCSNYALKRTALDHGHEFTPNARETVCRNFYVDDCLKSVASVEEAVAIATEIVALCKKGGFELTKFLSNLREFLGEIPMEIHDPSLKPLQPKPELPTERALGELWNIEDDTLGYAVQVKEEPVTKRSILVVISGIYDPIGHLSQWSLGELYHLNSTHSPMAQQRPMEQSHSSAWKMNKAKFMSDLWLERPVLHQLSQRLFREWN